MKYILVIYEGAADLPVDELEGRTPLEVARCPQAHRLAASGRCGLLEPVQDGLDGRNEVLLAVLCGQALEQAQELYRGPLEALVTSEDPSGYGFVYRGNFITVDDGLLTDCRVSGLSMEETHSLCAALQEGWDARDIKFVPTRNARFVALINRERLPVGYPPCLMEGERIDAFLAHGKEGELVRSVADRAFEVLSQHPVNEVRLDLGENPANAVWLWGGGPVRRRQSLGPSRLGAGALMSQSLLAEGYSRLADMRFVGVSDPWRDGLEGAAFKVAPLVEVLQETDYLLVYVESPQELGRYGGPVEKVRALERMDYHLLEPLMSVLDAYRPYRLLLASDGLVSSQDRHPTSGNVPVVIAGDGVTADELNRWDEASCARGTLGILTPARAVEWMRRI